MSPPRGLSVNVLSKKSGQKAGPLDIYLIDFKPNSPPEKWVYKNNNQPNNDEIEAAAGDMYQVLLPASPTYRTVYNDNGVPEGVVSKYDPLLVTADHYKNSKFDATSPAVYANLTDNVAAFAVCEILLEDTDYADLNAANWGLHPDGTIVKMDNGYCLSNVRAGITSKLLADGWLSESKSIYLRRMKDLGIEVTETDSELNKLFFKHLFKIILLGKEDLKNIFVSHLSDPIETDRVMNGMLHNIKQLSDGLALNDEFVRYINDPNTFGNILKEFKSTTDHNPHLKIDFSEMQKTCDQLKKPKPIQLPKAQIDLHAEIKAGDKAKILEAIKTIHPNKLNKDNKTVFYVAVENNRLDLIDDLIKAGGTPTLSCNGITPLHLAIQNGNEKMVKALLPATTELTTELMLAIEHGHPAVVKVILNHGVSANEEDVNTTIPPIHIAAKFNHAEIITDLLSFGADVDKPSLTHGDTALHVAAESGSHKATQALITNGANFAATNHDGETPIDVAVRCQQWSCVCLLLLNMKDDSALSNSARELIQLNAKSIIETIPNVITSTNRQLLKGSLLEQIFSKELESFHKHGSTPNDASIQSDATSPGIKPN